MTAHSAAITARLTEGRRALEERPLPCGLAAVYVIGARTTAPPSDVAPEPPSREQLRRESAARARERHGGRRLLPAS